MRQSFFADTYTLIDNCSLVLVLVFIFHITILKNNTKKIHVHRGGGKLHLIEEKPNPDA